MAKCVAFETGPNGSCTTYGWSTEDRTPIKATPEPDVKCYVSSAFNAKRRSDDFGNLVWKSAETVAFGVKSPWVVAWYCSNSFPAT